MQCPPCAHPDSIRYGTSRGVQRYRRCQSCRRIFQTLRRGKDPSLKQQACQLWDGDASCQPGSRHPSQDSLAGWCKLPKHSQRTYRRQRPAPSSKSLRTFIAKKSPNVGSG